MLQFHLLPEGENLIPQFKRALGQLRILDLCIHCGEVPSFMETALELWAPALHDLKILKIVFDRYVHQVFIYLLVEQDS